MKKMNNKGFSLVELIIVIAIMAILAGAIAPALIRYIDKSRKSNDVSSGKTIKTAVETAMGNEVAYEELTNNGSGSTIEVTPSGTTSAAVRYGLQRLHILYLQMIVTLMVQDAGSLLRILTKSISKI